MENYSDEQEYNVHEFFKKLLFQRDQRIEKLEKELAIRQQPSVVSDVEIQEKVATYQKNFEQQMTHATAQINAQKAQIQQLNEQIRKSQEGYNTLRQQKGGFGMLTVLTFMLGGILLGFGVHKLFFTARDPHQVAFENFRNAHQFDMEYQISQGQFDKVETTLKSSQEKKEYEGIRSELEFFRKIMGATRRKAMGDIAPNNSNSSDYIVEAQIEEAKIQTKAPQRLTITEESVTIRSEASTSGEKLGKLKKGEVVGVWDRTSTSDKLNTLLDGKRVEVKDYWYKIEAQDGTEGWIFGYFTSRSQNRFSYLDASADSLSKPQILAPAAQ